MLQSMDHFLDLVKRGKHSPPPLPLPPLLLKKMKKKLISLVRMTRRMPKPRS